MDVLRALFRDLWRFNDIDTIMEYVTVFGATLESSSRLQCFLQRRLVLPNPLLVGLYVLDPYRVSLITRIDTERQWISELAAMFNKAIYWQKLTNLAIVQNTLDRKNSTSFDLNIPLRRIVSRCDRILFINADFANIN
jgi:hypothetical protein